MLLFEPPESKPGSRKIIPSPLTKQLKALKKAKGLDNSYAPYKAAYSSVPSHAAANPAIQ